MTARRNISSGTAWEESVGYSRAVRVGNMVWLAGTTATDQQGRLPDADAAGQMRLVIDNAERALVAAGAGLQHVVSARLYVTDIQRWRDIGEVFRAHFGDVRPALTMVEVSRLIDPRMLIEMDLVAVVDQ